MKECSRISREEALISLVTQYETSILRTCYMYLQDKGLAEDATQETFLKAYKAFPNFRGECNEKTWLMRIAINTCRDIKRSSWFRNIDRRITIDSLPETSDAFHDDSDDDLAEAILNLSTKYKEVILLYFYQDMTMAEIAQVLKVSIATVGRRIKLACSKLESLLKKEETHAYGKNATSSSCKH